MVDVGTVAPDGGEPVILAEELCRPKKKYKVSM